MAYGTYLKEIKEKPGSEVRVEHFRDELQEKIERIKELSNESMKTLKIVVEPLFKATEELKDYVKVVFDTNNSNNHNNDHKKSQKSKSFVNKSLKCSKSMFLKE